jgi:hypothetical protein
MPDEKRIGLDGREIFDEPAPLDAPGGPRWLPPTLADRLNDPRGDPRSIKFEQDFADQTDVLMRAHFGN